MFLLEGLHFTPRQIPAGIHDVVKSLMRVPAAFRTARHIVKIIVMDTLDVKRHMAFALDEGQVAAHITVLDAGKLFRESGGGSA